MKHFATLLIAAVLVPLAARAEGWMQRLDDRSYVCQLTLPGTHDCATGNGFSGFIGTLVGPSMAQTQELSLQEQFARGVRAFDLRPAMSGSDIYCYHGQCQTSLSFNGAINQLCDLLDANPTEMAVVMVRHETDGDGNSDAWRGKMTTVMNNARYYGQLVAFRPDLTLGDCRGKIVMMSRDEFDCDKVGFVGGWSHSLDNPAGRPARVACGGTEAQLLVQDAYDCTADGGYIAKSDAIGTLARHSALGVLPTTHDCQWTVNHCSGYTQSASSDANRELASLTNGYLLSMLQGPTAPQGPLGIVMMDFAGADASSGYETLGGRLVDALIAHNDTYIPASADRAVTAKPMAVTDSETTWHTLSTPERDWRSIAVADDGSLTSVYGVTGPEGEWKFAKRPDGTYDIVNRKSGEYIDPASAGNNSPLRLAGSQPQQGWRYSKVSGTQYYVIYSASAQLHQTNSTLGYAVYNWGLSSSQPNRNDSGCRFLVQVTETEAHPQSGLQSIAVEAADAYDLQGRRLRTPSGLYISGGRLRR